MKRAIKAAIRTASVAAVVGISAICANAAQFRIQMPMEARWGSTILPAGDYTVTQLPDTNALKIVGEGKSVTLLVMTKDAEQTNVQPHVNVVRDGEVPAISTLTSSTTATTYKFFIKGEKNAPTDTVAIAMAKH